MSDLHAVRYFDGSAVREGTLVLENGAPRLRAGTAPADAARLPSLITGRFTDHHVHLQLIDHTLLPGSRLGRVVDLGAELEWISDLADEFAVRNSGESTAAPTRAAGTPANRAGSPELPTQIRFAGPFVTAVGGYPSDREWAPPGSVREIRDAEHAAAVVDELAAAGAACVKVVGHSAAGPVLSDDVMRAIAHRAAAHRIPVVAHAEGAGQAQRVVRLGATRLAHAPFTERLTDTEIAEQAASVSWISTMAIHDGTALAIVTDNVRRFFTAGGDVLYGTDMGNGPTPVDLRDAEIDALRTAGIDGLDLLGALAPADPLATDTPLLVLADDDPTQARHLTPKDLEF